MTILGCRGCGEIYQANRMIPKTCPRCGMDSFLNQPSKKGGPLDEAGLRMVQDARFLGLYDQFVECLKFYASEETYSKKILIGDREDFGSYWSKPIDQDRGKRAHVMIMALKEALDLDVLDLDGMKK